MPFLSTQTKLYEFSLLEFNQIAIDVSHGSGEYIKSLCYLLERDCNNTQVITQIKQHLLQSKTPARFAARMLAFRLKKNNAPTKPLNKNSSLNIFKQQIHSKKVKIIFAAYDLDYPATSFGHTFLLFRSMARPELLDYTISYAADMPEQAGATDLLQGLWGGYNGAVAINSLSQKLRSYAHQESRDLLEFELNLSPPEQDQLLDLIWQAQKESKPYYFINGNCASFIISLLDKIRPELALSEQNSISAIPLDTIKLLANNGLIKTRAHIRHSYKNRFLMKTETISEKTKHEIIRLATATTLSTSVTTERSTLQLAQEYLNHLISADKLPRAQAWQRRRDLSQQILKYPKSTSTTQPWLEPYSTQELIESHDSRRFSLSGGQVAGHAGADLSFRYAFHEQDDPWSKILGGFSTLEAMKLKLRLTENKVQLDHLYLANILSFKDRNQFFTPYSSSFALGFEQDYGKDNHAMPFIKLGRGISYTRQQVVFFAMLEPLLGLESYDNLKPLFLLENQLGLQTQQGKHNLGLSFHRPLAIMGKNQIKYQTQFNYGYQFDHQLQLEFELTQEQQKHTAYQSATLGLHWYF